MEEKITYQIQFQPLGKRVIAEEGITVFEAARQAGIELTSACGGEGNCGQCQVVLLSGKVSPVTGDEEFLISGKDRQNGYRLACCMQVLSDLKIHIPQDSLITGQRLQIESNLNMIAPDPSILEYPVEIPIPTMHDVRSDLSRLKDALQAAHHLESLFAGEPVIRSLSPALRAADWKVNAFVRDGEIIAVRPQGQSPLGFAVDLGTTKIAASLVNLGTGEILCSNGAPNPQISYGEDVISRLNYAVRNPDGGQVLAEKVQHSLNELLGDLVNHAGVERAQVAEACIVGNTAMTHLLLHYPVLQLAKAPYVAAASDALDVPAKTLGLEMAPGAVVYIPPTIGGFVGPDHVSMVLASDLDQSNKVTLGLDIGTNTEISLRKPGEEHLVAVSCASGPAFEGAHIRDGMRAASGAIEKVRIGEQGVELTTIGDAPAVGLCGSGILDTIAELFKAGYIDRNSRFKQDHGKVRLGDHGPEFVLVPAEQSGSGRDIAITQKDVNEIVLAKGAIQAGLNILLEATGTAPETVEEVIIAGAFGSFLNIKSAISMGLFPHLPNAQYRQVGNAAALGAIWILISRSARLRALEIGRQTRYLELTTYPKFNRQFAMAMMFP
ncbi:MAG: DUF4445 domain-containing protein [Chloroflexi bacterium]|nr:MAG: DUF4445 domain-containing protein [Chloroflexota bacterium]